MCSISMYWTVSYTHLDVYKRQAYSSGGERLFLLGQPMKMAAVMMAIIPIKCAYPFFQKYFDKGVMVGSIKAVSYTHLDVYKRQV